MQFTKRVVKQEKIVCTVDEFMDNHFGSISAFYNDLDEITYLAFISKDNVDYSHRPCALTVPLKKDEDFDEITRNKLSIRDHLKAYFNETDQKFISVDLNKNLSQQIDRKWYKDIEQEYNALHTHYIVEYEKNFKPRRLHALLTIEGVRGWKKQQAISINSFIDNLLKLKSKYQPMGTPDTGHRVQFSHVGLVREEHVDLEVVVHKSTWDFYNYIGYDTIKKNHYDFVYQIDVGVNA